MTEELKPGDEVLVRCKVEGVSGSHVAWEHLVRVPSTDTLDVDLHAFRTKDVSPLAAIRELIAASDHARHSFPVDRTDAMRWNYEDAEDADDAINVRARLDSAIGSPAIQRLAEEEAV